MTKKSEENRNEDRASRFNWEPEHLVIEPDKSEPPKEKKK